MVKLKIKNIAYHRNGIGGAGFHVVLFGDKSVRPMRNMIGIVFESSGHVAVLDTDLLTQGNIKMGENSWRGDEYERTLRKAVVDYDSCG